MQFLVEDVYNTSTDVLLQTLCNEFTLMINKDQKLIKNAEISLLSRLNKDFAKWVELDNWPQAQLISD